MSTDEVTNSWLVRNFKHRKKRQAELRRLKNQVKRLNRQIERREWQQRFLDRVTEVRDGVALKVEEGTNIYGPWFHVSYISTGDDERAADVYTGASGREKCGLRTFGWVMKYRWPKKKGPYLDWVESWHGLRWDYDDAVEAAYAWVVHGIKPEDK